uniref:Uncharacterized protein n=1 Tax=Anguilla anguilla TaxID=7936 RepID=A0A0E9VBY8_ANGAN
MSNGERPTEMVLWSLGWNLICTREKQGKSP